MQVILGPCCCFFCVLSNDMLNVSIGTFSKKIHAPILSHSKIWHLQTLAPYLVMPQNHTCPYKNQGFMELDSQFTLALHEHLVELQHSFSTPLCDLEPQLNLINSSKIPLENTPSDPFLDSQKGWPARLPFT